MPLSAIFTPKPDHMKRFLLFAILLFAFLTLSPVVSMAQEPEEPEIDFKFDPSKFKMGNKHHKRTDVNAYWGFGPTFVTSNTEVQGTYYPEFKPWNSWSNDLGLMITTRLGGVNSPVNLNYGLLWRYINIETDQAVLDWDPDTEVPAYFEDTDYDNTESNIHTLSIPLMLEYNRKFIIGAGGFIAYRIASSSEADGKTDRGDAEQTLRADLGFNDFFYGVSGHLGYKRFRVYMNYYLNNIFAKDTPYDFSVMNIGLCFQ